MTPGVYTCLPILAVELYVLYCLGEANVYASGIHTVTIWVRFWPVEWHNSAYYTKCMIGPFVAKSVFFQKLVAGR